MLVLVKFKEIELKPEELEEELERIAREFEENGYYDWSYEDLIEEAEKKGLFKALEFEIAEPDIKEITVSYILFNSKKARKSLLEKGFLYTVRNTYKEERLLLSLSNGWRKKVLRSSILGIRRFNCKPEDLHRRGVVKKAETLQMQALNLPLQSDVSKKKSTFFR